MDSQKFNRQTFQEWRDHPVNQPFFQYLRDRHLELSLAWGRGVILDPSSQPWAILYHQLENLQWETVEALYQSSDDE